MVIFGGFGDVTFRALITAAPDVASKYGKYLSTFGVVTEPVRHGRIFGGPRHDTWPFGDHFRGLAAHEIGRPEGHFRGFGCKFAGPAGPFSGFCAYDILALIPGS